MSPRTKTLLIFLHLIASQSQMGELFRKRNPISVQSLFNSTMPHVTWFLALLLMTDGHCHKSDTVASLYEEGTLAYLEERYPSCVEKLESALKKYNSHRKNTENCRLTCRYDVENLEPLFPVDIEDLRFHEKNIKNTLCLINCKISTNGNNDNIDWETQKIFEKKKPYEYLHLCYFKVNDKQRAASAAFTFLVSNPDNKIMSEVLQKYAELPEVEMKDVVNFEAKDYVYLYVYGVDAYEKKEWTTAINNMEESLVSYLHAEDECRAQCEGPFDPGWYPDFVPAMANHFTYVLKCKQKCKKQLGSLNGEIYDDLLASHYHYLQYAYFKKGNLNAACQAVASYLLFLPEDETMLANMRFYQVLPKVQDDFFTPRDEAIRYAQRETYEKRILKYIKNEFHFNQQADKMKETKNSRRNFATGPELTGGEKRFTADGVASAKDCFTLTRIVDAFADTNDGYRDGKTSPHTDFEKFEGVTLSRIAFLVYIGIIPPKYLRVLLEVTEIIREKLTEKFGVEERLYFSYTHLVCRSALTDNSARTDFSHMIHADNCNLLSDFDCEKKSPAFHWRDYSAILYLNDDFDGGEFIFASDSKGRQIQSTISPKCGRLVAFSSGKENLHGVKAVTRGKRCAVAVWFTFDPKYKEFDRDIARHMLDNSITFDQYFEEKLEEFLV